MPPLPEKSKLKHMHRDELLKMELFDVKPPERSELAGLRRASPGGSTDDRRASPGGSTDDRRASLGQVGSGTMGVGEAVQSVSISHRIALVCYPFMLRFVPVAILKVNGCTCWPMLARFLRFVRYLHVVFHPCVVIWLYDGVAIACNIPLSPHGNGSCCKAKAEKTACEWAQKASRSEKEVRY